MADNFKIVDEFYVGLQKRGELTLAFLTPNGTDKAALSRISTVDTWAKSCYIDSTTLPSIVVKNQLLSGYSIEKCVYRRYWGGGNVVWTIQDPRGFAFEISSSNMAKLLECVTIINGEIQGECIIGRNGSQNVLLPKDSQPYKDSVAFTAMNNTLPTISIKDVLPGSIIKHKSGNTNTYLGSYYAITCNKAYSRMCYILGFDLTSKPLHFYYNYTDKELSEKYGVDAFASAPVIHNIEPDHIKNVNFVDSINKKEYIGFNGKRDIIEVLDSVKKPKVFKIQLEETSIHQFTKENIIIKIYDNFYMLTCQHYNNNLTAMKISLKDDIIEISNSTSRYMPTSIDEEYYNQNIRDIYPHYKVYALYDANKVDITKSVRY